METTNSEPLFIVGIGASAGGLAPLKAFVHSLPAASGMAYIIIQHLDPNHESMLSDILDRESIMPVSDAKDGQPVAPDNVYVIPPNTDLEIQDGVIRLGQPGNTHGTRKNIDRFFRSLAAECGANCAGIVLSGSGGDGTAGLRAIKASGGLTLAQDPSEAEHPSMPETALQANVVDRSAPVAEMHGLLKQYAEHPLARGEDSPHPTLKEAETPEESLNDIAAILKTHEGFELNQYKPTTVLRRIARRMSLTDTNSYSTYLQLLRENREERRQLTKELLINVTDFFRDPDAFEILEQQVIPRILESLAPDEDIRIWIAGCASGEEAYSIAILFMEAVSKARRQHHIRIFATDIDEYAIKIARTAKYPDSITAEVPAKYLEKYFTKVENDHYY